MKLLVYVPLLTPRIKYIFNFIFNDILKTEVGFSVNIQEFIESDLPKFCYAPQPIGGELFFKSTDLLLDYKIYTQHIKITDFGESKVPFAVEKSTLPFDVFAASFYFLSRYEEYLPFESKGDDLYPAEISLQYKLELLKLPIIDGWALILKNILVKRFPSISFERKNFNFIAAYSIYPKIQVRDNNMIVNAIRYLKSFIDIKASRDEEKLAGIGNMISNLQKESLASKNMKVFIPSQNKDHYFESEMKMPKSYVKLTKNNTGNDYSMYYPNYPGFRAGTCTPFHWYDLQIEKKTQLMVHPVASTDTALLHDKTLEELLQQAEELVANVKLVNGSFYFLSLQHDIQA